LPYEWVALAEFWVSLDVDAGRCSEDIGTQRELMIDPQMWRELFKPEMAQTNVNSCCLHGQKRD
jgi:hypothetical protein